MADEWVALTTFSNDDDAKAPPGFETGRVYSMIPRKPAVGVQTFRELAPDEHVAVCPRCGHRFATTEDGTADSHRDRHFDTDWLCRDLPHLRARGWVHRKAGRMDDWPVIDLEDLWTIACADGVTLSARVMSRGEWGFEGQVLHDGELFVAQRFHMREQAERWAEAERKAIERRQVDNG